MTVWRGLPQDGASRGEMNRKAINMWQWDTAPQEQAIKYDKTAQWQFDFHNRKDHFLYSKSFRTCHPERRTSPVKRDECKLKDPENVSIAHASSGSSLDAFRIPSCLLGMIYNKSQADYR
jgi:hypothetical protein